MSIVAELVSDIFGGGEAEKSAEDAAQIAAQAQTEALDYLREVEEVPQALREEALRRVGGLYGLEGGVGSQEEIIGQARRSPYYEAMMDERERAILRNAAATGGLRSGNVQGALSDSAARTLAESYGQQLQGLTGLSQLPSRAESIAAQMSGIGQTLAQGRIAGAQARQSAIGTGINTGLGLGGLILGI